MPDKKTKKLKVLIALITHRHGENVYVGATKKEITQEVMVRAFENLPRLRVPRAFWSWLLTVAASIVSDRRSSSAKRRLLRARQPRWPRRSRKQLPSNPRTGKKGCRWRPKTPTWKKAVVRLKDGEVIAVFEN